MCEGIEPKKNESWTFNFISENTMRLRQVTLNELQTYYSNRCCFCEYGKWHLPPFYLICTKTYDTRTPTLTIHRHEKRRTLQ